MYGQTALQEEDLTQLTAYVMIYGQQREKFHNRNGITVPGTLSDQRDAIL
jgi:hypothetical protein